ncbi:hypothetical protein BDR04DRAFT_1078251 [Suillus decipiens]|nr:hypothetical protein BDR04DRAFT_1078251 [Suillus decipiens]
MSPKALIEIHPGKFSLNVSGVAGFFGGDEAISAIQTIHHYKYRKWMGWYNSPGSWNVGKKFGKLAKSRLWDGLFPGPDEEPAECFELDGKQGPKYVASRSGSVLEYTGHLAYLIMQISKEELGIQVEGKRITKQNKTLPNEEPARTIPPRSGRHALFAIIPMTVSITTCVLCACMLDWFCFSMILLGIVSNGTFSVVIGSARLVLQGVNSASTAPPGDGMLMDGDNIVLLFGKEEDIATITRGKFVLEYNSLIRDEYNAIGLCSFLLVIQLLLQLLFIPQGKFGGQIMFLISFAFSWAYNLYLSSIDNEYIQEQLILRELRLEEKHIQTFVFGTRTTAAVFACLMLQPPEAFDESEWEPLGFKPENIIHHFIPNDTPVWTAWREKVLDVMRNRKGNQDAWHGRGLLQMSSDEDQRFRPADRELLRQLLEDARIAYDQAMNEQNWLTG